MGQLQVLLREYIDTDMDEKMEQEKISHFGYDVCLILFILKI